MAVTAPVNAWAKIYSGSALYDLKETPDGGLIVCGESGDPQGVQFPSFLWIARLSSMGDILWEKGFGPSYSNVRSFGVKPTSDGGYVLIGTMWAIGAGNYDLVVIKMDSNGNIQWQRAYGDAGNNGGRTILQTNDGGFLIADLYSTRIVRLNSTGDIVWERRYEADSWSHFRSDIVQTTDGGFVVVGRSGVSDGLVLKMNADGSVSWEKRLTGVSRLNSVQQTANDDYIIGGTFLGGVGDDDAWLGRLDSAGNLLWQTQYGLPAFEEGVSDIRVASDGGFLVAGHIDSAVPSGDFWVFKTDANGVIQWQKRYSSGGGYERATEIELTAGGGFVVGGTSSITNSLIIKSAIDGEIPGFSIDTSAPAQSTSFTFSSFSEVPTTPTSTVTVTSLTIVPRNTIVQQIAP